MKKYIYFFALALTASLFTACSHDYNYDDEYDVKGYFSGSDPRNNMVFFTTKNAEYTNNFIGDLHLGDDAHMFTFTAAVSRNLTKAAKAQVAHAADAPLLATTYKGYQVATAEQVAFNNNGTIELGTDAVKFDVPVTVKGLANMTKPTVVPFRITPSEKGELTSPEAVRQDYGYIVINPKDVWTTDYDTQEIFVNFNENGSSYLAEDPQAIVELTTESEFAYKGKIGLERDNSIFQSDGNAKLAPEGITTTEKVDCEGKKKVIVSASFTNAAKFTTPGDYVLPMRAVYYDENGAKHNLVKGEILIPIKVIDIYIEESEEKPQGTEISNTGWKVTLSPASNYYTTEKLLDGNTQTGIYINRGVNSIVVDLGQKEDIKGIQLGMYITWYNYYPRTVKFYSSDDNMNWKLLSEDIQIDQTEWNNYTTRKPLSTRYLKMEFKVTSRDASLSEIKIFK